MKTTLDQQMLQLNASKQSSRAEKSKDKERIDLQTQKRDDEEKQVNEYKKQQQEIYRQALLEQQAADREKRDIIGYRIESSTQDTRKDKAALAMETGVDPYRPNPIVNPISHRQNPYIAGHGNVLKEAALSSLQSK